jgi:hypothetical protein
VYKDRSGQDKGDPRIIPPLRNWPKLYNVLYTDVLSCHTYVHIYGIEINVQHVPTSCPVTLIFFCHMSTRLKRKSKEYFEILEGKTICRLHRILPKELVLG